MDPWGFMWRVVTLCCKWGGSVSSWGRTQKHNKEVGGVEKSIHLLWLGADVILDLMEKNPDFEKDADLVGLEAIFESDHYHLQPKGI